MSLITKNKISSLYYCEPAIRSEVLGLTHTKIRLPLRVRGTSPSVVLDNLTQLFLRGGYDN